MKVMCSFTEQDCKMEGIMSPGWVTNVYAEVQVHRRVLATEYVHPDLQIGFHSDTQ